MIWKHWAEVLATGRAVRARFSPVKLNYFTLGNQVPHLHTHVLPRYRDDPAPGGPIVWEDIFLPDPVPDAKLHAQLFHCPPFQALWSPTYPWSRSPSVWSVRL